MQSPPNPDAAHDKAGASYRDSGRAWYVLGVLTAAYALAYIDRQILNLLVDPVKHSLALSDVQISLLQGFAFMAAYIGFAPLMGRLVDVSHRRNILLIGCCLWSIFTALCGMADSFWELFLARFGVGASEACILPAGWSLIADYFSSKKAGRAFSIFMLGPLLGGGLALIAGGAVVASADGIRAALPVLAIFETWQLAFMMVGLSGLTVAVLLLSVSEPARMTMLSATTDERQFSLRDALAFIWRRRQLYSRIMFGMGMIAIVVLGVPAWMPAFLTRHYGVDRALVGFQFGGVVLSTGVAGVLAGPWVARWFEGQGRVDGVIRTAAIAAFVMMLCSATIPFMPTAESAMAVTGILTFTYSVPTGIMAAALQIGTPNRVRGVVASLYTFTMQVMGLGIAPTAIAFVTDYVLQDAAKVGWSLGIVCTGASICAVWLFVTALPHFRQVIAEEKETAHAPQLS